MYRIQCIDWSATFSFFKFYVIVLKKYVQCKPKNQNCLICHIEIIIDIFFYISSSSHNFMKVTFLGKAQRSHRDWPVWNVIGHFVCTSSATILGSLPGNIAIILLTRLSDKGPVTYAPRSFTWLLVHKSGRFRNNTGQFLCNL